MTNKNLNISSWGTNSRCLQCVENIRQDGTCSINCASTIRVGDFCPICSNRIPYERMREWELTCSESCEAIHLTPIPARG